MNIGERTLNNALFSVVSSLLPLLLSFIFWPYIVGSLGEASYGVFALVSSVVGYFALLDLGLGNAVVKYVAEYTGKEDRERTGEVIGVAASVFMVAGLIGVILILTIAKALATQLLKIPPELVTVAYHAFCIASLGFFLTMQLTLFTSITNGLNRYDISSCLTAILGVLSTVGAVLLLWMGFRLIHLVAFNVVALLLILLVASVIVRRLLPREIHFRFRLKKDTLKPILHFGMYTMLSRVTDVISRQVNLLVIGALIGVDSVTYYYIPATILNRLTNLIGRTGMVVFPAISELQGQNRPDTIRDLYLTSTRIILSFSTAFTVSLLVFGIRFLKLWMSPEFAEHSGLVLVLITLGVFMNQWSNIPTHVVNGLGRPKISGLTAISYALLFLILMIPGAIYGGIIGVAIAQLLATVVVIPFFICYVNCTVLDIPLIRLLKESYLRPLMAGGIVLIVLLLVPQARINNIFLLLFVMGASMCLYLAVALLLGVYQERERRVLAEYLKRIWSRIQHRKKPK